MKAMILAAGEGRRMLPLTENTPKPLLEVKGTALIEHHLIALQRAGICEIIINVAYLAEQIMDRVGDGGKYGVEIKYSREDSPLETGGALFNAKPLLGDAPFLLVNADIYTQFDYAELAQMALGDAKGHLVFVNNPPHNIAGDFQLDSSGLVQFNNGGSGYTFAGISMLSPTLIDQYPQKRAFFALREVFDYAISQGQLSGEYYSGIWADVGTPERLAALQ